MAALPRILSPADLPLAELSAARLDGELFACGRGWAPPDVPGTREDRALAAAVGLPRRWVAELGTAAWVWGAGLVAEDPVRFCVPSDARGPRARPGVVLRERALGPGDWRDLGGVRVTTPVRTLLDLLRSPAEPDEQLAAGMLELVALEDRGDLESRMRRLPDGRRARERLRRISRR